jgi:hypothetical protein
MSGYDYLIRCSICKCEARQFFDDVRPGDHFEACRVGRNLMHGQGWRQPWFMHMQDVCPECMAQTEKAIIPGWGIELVPKIMIEQGSAIRLSDFLKARQLNDQEKGE